MITWLALMRAETKAATADTAGDSYLLNALRHCESRLFSQLGWEFVPRKQTLYCDAWGHGIDAARNNLDLPQPLLEPTAVTLGDASSLGLTTDYSGIPTTYPYWKLHLTPGNAGRWYTPTSAGDFVNATSITGVWGYRTQYTEAWLSSGDTVADNPLSSSATTVTVTSVAGVDALNRTPRFSAGQLLKIESEYLEVMATPTSATLTVRRGQRGSTAVSHIATTPISIWTAEPAMERAVNRWVSYLYSRRSEFSTATFDGVASVNFPPDLPSEVQNIIDDLIPKRMYIL